MKTYHKAYYERNKDRIDKKNLDNYHRNKELWCESRRLSTKKFLLDHPTYRKEWRLRIKIFVIKYYTDGKNCCNCCGEKEFNFLSVDHMDGGGLKHRKVAKIYDIYYYLLKNRLPDGYQILCFNCNCARGFFGKCPHELQRVDLLSIS